MKIVLIGAAVVFVNLTSPGLVHAQQWWGWPGWSEPSYQQPNLEPRFQTRRVVHREHRDEHHERREPAVHTVTKTKIVRQTWQDMSQDRAREWIKEQVQGFCGKYVKDEACIRKE